MSQKAIREVDGKRMLATWFSTRSAAFPECGSHYLQLTQESLLHKHDLPLRHPWLKTEKLVVKPDQLIKRRGKAGLVKLNATWEEVLEWVQERMGKEIKVEAVSGVLDTFIVETFVPHASSEEYYISIISQREGEQIYFYHEGGVDVGDVDSKAEKYLNPVGTPLTKDVIKSKLLVKVPTEKHEVLAGYIEELFKFYIECNFAYLEINPLVMKEGKIYALDLAAKVDQTAHYEMGDKWGHLDFPAPFGRKQTPEEQYIAQLDSKTGASLKLTILNAEGRVWTMVAGGGASVVFADTISDLGYGKELANYGEYSGDPSEGLTCEYAKVILDLMTRKLDDRGKVLIIGGGIANFTNVAETFKGIVRALKQYKDKLLANKVKIFVRRGGPNYQNGLQMMIDCGESTGIPIEVFGPETHITSIVSYALGVKQVPVEHVTQEAPKFSVKSAEYFTKGTLKRNSSKEALSSAEEEENPAALFTKDTIAVIYGMQPKAVQNMLDFDHLCARKKPSVVAMIYPFGGDHFQKFYWGANEILIPVYHRMSDCLTKHPEATVMVNFASCRSVYPSVIETLQFPQIRVIAIIAEGVPEIRTKALIQKAKEKGVTIIGPATVGGIKPGCFKIGNTGGMIDNIIASKLYRPGSVAYVSRSGGMSNELNNIISRNSDGVAEGVAIGGDRFPGTTFLDHMLRYEKDPQVKIIVLLGEVGGTDEYDICDAITSKKLTKPVVAWCMGTCAKVFPYEVQFGHAGASARGNVETAEAKNAAMKAAGAIVPPSFEEFGNTIRKVYEQLVESGAIIPKPEPEVPSIPMDYSWAQSLGLIRKPANFVSTISDERGDELMYAGVPISTIYSEDMGVGGVLSLLWFKRRLPKYCTKFIEMVLVVVADHGPAVSGAHNTIVAARAGKDLISSVVSGMMTIGPRFGGAIDDAAEQFSNAYDTQMKPKDFVETMRKEGKLIMGIGHRVKSVQNPDSRVVILKDFALNNFPNNDILKYALEVEKITTAKRENLILNVDGVIGTCFVDLMRGCGAFSREEADSYLKTGCLNGLFVLGRSIGLIGHFLDQTRLKQPLYRHPWEDISYIDDSYGTQ